MAGTSDDRDHSPPDAAPPPPPDTAPTPPPDTAPAASPSHMAVSWSERALAWGARRVRVWARRLQTQRTTVGPMRKVALAALFVPVFSVWLALLRLHSWRRGGIALVAETDGGMRLRCRPPDLVPMYIYLFGLWEPDLTAFLRQRLRPGGVFIDVGANIGYYGLEAARFLGPGGRVVAIEPAPWILAELRHNVRINDLDDRVRVVDRAAAGSVGMVDLYAGPAMNVGLTTTVASRGFRRTATVEAAPLGSLLEPEECRRAAVIKIDVEGAEAGVIDGLIELLPILPHDVDLLIELSPAWWPDRSRTPDQILAPLCAAGFRAFTMENSYWPWRYLWPRCCAPPRAVRGPLPAAVKRIDLLLTRRAPVADGPSPV